MMNAVTSLKAEMRVLSRPQVKAKERLLPKVRMQSRRLSARPVQRLET